MTRIFPTLAVLSALMVLAAVLTGCRAEGDDDDAGRPDGPVADDDAGGDDTEVSFPKFCAFVASSGKGRLEECSGVPVLHVEGSPYEIGFQEGELLNDRITNLIHFVRTFIDPLGLAWDVLQNADKNLAPNIRPDYAEEIQGMVDGLNSDITYRELVAGNCLGDIFGAVRAFMDNYLNLDFCSLAAAWGNATEDGEMIVMRNFDYMNVFTPYNYVGVVKPNEGHAFVYTGIAGLIGVHTGMNDLGITGALAYNSSYDSDMRGVPMLLQLREAIQFGESVEEAENVILSGDRTMGLNYMFTDAFEDKAEVLEESGGKSAVRRAGDEDFLVATNHYVDPTMLSQQRGYEETDSTMVRYKRINELLGEYSGGINLPIASRIMRDHFDATLGRDYPGPRSVCRHDDVDYRPGSLMNLFVSTSNATALMKPVDGTYCVTITKHACEMPYYCFKPFEEK